MWLAYGTELNNKLMHDIIRIQNNASSDLDILKQWQWTKVGENNKY